MAALQRQHQCRQLLAGAKPYLQSHRHKRPSPGMLGQSCGGFGQNTLQPVGHIFVAGGTGQNFVLQLGRQEIHQPVDPENNLLLGERAPIQLVRGKLPCKAA
ncbi:hypothetical protein D3C75_913860 [compost metagenome]